MSSAADTKKAGSMDGLLAWNIKDVIAAYPAVGSLLHEFNVGCVTCSVGTCKLKDVVSIHSLPAEQEQEMFRRIARVVFPGVDVALPQSAGRAVASGRSVGMALPFKELVEEHTCIKRVLALIPGLVSVRQLDLDRATQFREVVDFIRNFADRFHHAKEEDVLFKYFDETSEMLVTMHKEHEIGRTHVRAVAEGIEKGDMPAITEHLSAYGLLLKEHIRKEDEILYPWMRGQLTDTQVGRLFSQFSEVDVRFGDKPDSYRMWVEKLERTNKQRE